MAAKGRYKIINIEEELGKRLTTPERRAEYEATRNALFFGITVCMRREELGYRQKDMKQFGIPAETMCRIEKGDRLPNSATQMKLTRALQAEIVIGPSGEWKLRPVAEMELQKAA